MPDLVRCVRRLLVMLVFPALGFGCGGGGGGAAPPPAFVAPTPTPSPPPAGALLARSSRAGRDVQKRRYEEAWPALQAIRDDAELVGNARVRGAVGRHLATIALLQRRRGSAHRCLEWALPLLVHYGTRHALAQAGEIARRLHL